MSKISTEHLARHAYVYVRQSTLDQVHHNLESQRRQYGLVERARALGWGEVIVIDDDLGRSGGGVHRPGFERLLAALCEGIVGAVFCVEASRLARNGRDWHTLLEFCRLVDAIIIDEETVYNPRQPDDRLLLGMKGAFSEMELSILRQRSYAALMQKAHRGELLTTVPIGFLRARNDRIELDPDQRIREAVGLVFRRFREIGSIRQVLLGLRQERIELPAVVYGPEGRGVVWQLPGYHAVNKMLRNPTYGGAYAYGRTKTITRIEHGREKNLKGQRVEQQDWQILIPEHHAGYIEWDEFEANQRQILHNANMKGVMVRGPARKGGALLAGLLRCGHCGRKLHVAYSGTTGQCLRYDCRGARNNHGTDRCIAFGGLRADQEVADEVLRRLRPLGIRAALVAIDQQAQLADERVRQKELALEQACFEVARARRQYDAVDPENRLVAAELERRWNEALKHQSEIEQELATRREQQPTRLSEATQERLVHLGEDLPTLWHHPQSPPDLKKRILRTVVQEIVVRRDGDKIAMLLHWHGGDHTSIEFITTKTGKHRWSTPEDTITLVRELARVQPDQGITATLNRLGKRTAHGHTWTEARVRVFRNDHGIAVYGEDERRDRGELTLEESAKALGVSTMTVRRLIERKILPAQHACIGAPWIIQQADVQRVATMPALGLGPRTVDADQITLQFE
jgi:DNA invertase Pin-like site-specific DNA recombinase